MNTEILIPIYRPPIVKSGATAEYNIIGWIGFVPTSTSGGGDAATVTGYFTRVVWDALEKDTVGASDPDFGVRTIVLAE